MWDEDQLALRLPLPADESRADNPRDQPGNVLPGAVGRRRRAAVADHTSGGACAVPGEVRHHLDPDAGPRARLTALGNPRVRRRRAPPPRVGPRRQFGPPRAERHGEQLDPPATGEGPLRLQPAPGPFRVRGDRGDLSARLTGGSSKDGRVDRLDRF